MFHQTGSKDCKTFFSKGGAKQGIQGSLNVLLNLTPDAKMICPLDDKVQIWKPWFYTGKLFNF